MNFRRRREDEFELNVIPLVDVMFVLLLFFMVTTTFKEEFEVGIDLPRAASESKIPEKPLEIAIDAQGEFFVNGQKVVDTQLPTLKRAIQKIAGDDVKQLVVLSADAKTPHQAVITAMDAARQLGFSRLSFATQQLSNK